MSYLVLARRYRPQKFSDLVGQEHVTETLKNALKMDRTAHAYLFTGPRGVGKTSAARILAKALRCEQPSEDREPCNECSSCKSVNNGNSLDVIEIDAASNTGVENIRELRENVGFMASQGKYRIYVIDEVHMLSTAAFNALLKTLEEPPPHVFFIFATTELHKVLATIQSRCQRFDFKRIPDKVIMENLKTICGKESIAIDEASLRAVAMEADGCLRDAQSLLDQAIALCGESINIDSLEQALGIVERGRFFKLVDAISQHNTAEALKTCHEMLEMGLDPKVFIQRLATYFRDLHYFYFTGQATTDDSQQLESFESLKKALSDDEVVRALDLLIKTQGTLNSSINAGVTAESLVVKLSLQRPVQTITDSPAPPTSAPKRPAPQANPKIVPPKKTLSPAAPNDPPPPPSGNARQDLENYIRQKKAAWTPVLKSILSIEKKDQMISVTVKKDFAGKRLASSDGIELLKTALNTKFAQVDFDESSSAERPPSAQEIMKQKRSLAKEHEAVQSAIEVFDAVVSETKIFNEKNKEKNR